MDQITADLIQTVSLEVIKILGPAFIAAYVGYKTAYIQLKIKTEELKRSHSFQARQEIFSDLRDRIARSDKNLFEINKELGEMIGFAEGFKGEDLDSSTNPLLNLFGEAADSIAKSTRISIRATLRDMENEGLTETDEYKELLSLREINLSLTDYSYVAVRKNLLQLREIHSLIVCATQETLKIKMHAAFKPYLND
ncbi:hypothetical protein [Microvirgula aerodenitrificans]|uniref:hypothetical protein n=1 Tax=Microvirgula aerodenitrificans TaxID=57480 RepID=UPI0028EE3970|nr:hypothetical protein [Microvirgula aerodenitrificans]